MERERVLEVGLFDVTGREVRLVGRTLNPAIVEQVRGLLAAEQRRELSALESPVRLVPDPKDQGGV